MTDNLTYINPTTRQFPKRTSPLASDGVAPGYYLTDAGTVAPIPMSSQATTTPKVKSNK